MIRTLLISLGLIFFVSGCTHWIDKGQTGGRSESEFCQHLRTRIHHSTVQPHPSGRLYTPADKANLIQEYEHAGCSY